MSYKILIVAHAVFSSSGSISVTTEEFDTQEEALVAHSRVNEITRSNRFAISATLLFNPIPPDPEPEQERRVRV